MTIKVCNLAKELEIKSEIVLDQLKKLYVDVEDENSYIDDKIAALVHVKLGVMDRPKKVKIKSAPKPKSEKIAVKKKAAEKEKPEIKQEEQKKEQEKQEIEDIGEKPNEEEKSELARPLAAGELRPLEPKESKPEKYKKPGKGVQKPKPAIEIIEKGDYKLKSKRYIPGQTKFKSFTADKKGFVSDTRQASFRKTPLKIQIPFPVNIRILAPRINVKPNVIIQYLMGKGIVSNINQDMDESSVRNIMENFGYELEISQTIESIEKELVAEHYEEDKSLLKVRAPVVTFMGHVDHGKTSLLDYIRKTMVTKGEKGGITQHIGAYRVERANGAVTFLDTPGHAAFTAMRARGAHVTDVVVLVVAADDGVMPQTKEAIDHARAADVTIVVAINKCDLASANPDKVRKELQKEGLMPEEWGGKTIMAEVSAHTGQGVEHLMEMLMLESEMLELKANPSLKARGVVIESKKTSGQGPAATLLVQNGTLYPGDIVLCGRYYGKVKAMINDKGERIKEASPSMPVEILGLGGVPEAGEEFFVVKDEKKAKILADLKQNEERHKNLAGRERLTLEDLYARIKEGSVKELTMILKADVQGSIEALKSSLENLSTEEVKVKIIRAACGNINESDVMLAMVSNAVIIGFHVKLEPAAEDSAKDKKVDVHSYDIIYEAIADVKAGMEGLLEPEEREVFQGTAQVLEIFATKGGSVAGCLVTKGVILRKGRVRVKRAQEKIYEGEISSLKRFKDDVREVRESFECGIAIKNFDGFRKNDIIETFIIEKIARRLESR